MVASQANEESGAIKKDALDSSFYAIIDNGDEDIVMTIDEAKIEQDRVQFVAAPSNKSADSETALAHSRPKLVPTRGDLKPLRALRSGAGSRGRAAVVRAAKGSNRFQASAIGNEFATGMRNDSFRIVALVGGGGDNLNAIMFSLRFIDSHNDVFVAMINYCVKARI
ncbi:hypothetical protein RUND412_008480 [Rhizina undulata]